jgi:prepilin-type N-terminal cleavage/methylation domain-containing protein
MLKEKNSSRKSGITFLELLIVIAIIGILSAVAVPSIADISPHYKLRGGSQELISALRNAQNLATTTQQNHLIRFYPSNNSYSLIRSISGTETIIQTNNLPSTVSFSSINLTNNQVIFSSSGAPDNSGTILLTNTKNEHITIEITNSGQIKSY